MNASVDDVKEFVAESQQAALSMAESSRPSAVIARRMGAVSLRWPTSRTRLTAPW
jgi:hypothetical protein